MFTRGPEGGDKDCECEEESPRLGWIYPLSVAQGVESSLRTPGQLDTRQNRRSRDYELF